MSSVYCLFTYCHFDQWDRLAEVTASGSLWSSEEFIWFFFRTKNPFDFASLNLVLHYWTSLIGFLFLSALVWNSEWQNSLDDVALANPAAFRCVSFLSLLCCSFFSVVTFCHWPLGWTMFSNGLNILKLLQFFGWRFFLSCFCLASLVDACSLIKDEQALYGWR